MSCVLKKNFFFGFSRLIKKASNSGRKEMCLSLFFLRWRESVLGRTGGEGTTEKERKREGKGKI